jgi:plastocyanin
MPVKKLLFSIFATALFSLSFNMLASAGTITGTITYDGPIPKFKEIKMDADPICLTHHNAPVYPQTLLLGDNQTLGNVFVYVKSGLPKTAYPPPAEPVVITQKGCEYTPHVAGVLIGQTLKILNPDGTLHNVHAMSKINPEFNLAMPKFRTETSKTFDKAEFMFPMKCDVHPWMGAWISVMDHPFFATTPKEGTFTIVNLPEGVYEVEAWHEKLGTKTMKVTVGADDTQTLEFVFSKPGSKSTPEAE